MRGNFDSFYDPNPNGTVGGSTLASVARTFHRRTYSAVLGDTAILTPQIVNTVRAQLQLALRITEFDPVVFGTQFVVPISSGGTFTSGTSQSATGATNSGNTGATTDRPVIHGAVIGRNTGRGNGLYSVDPFLSRSFPLWRERLDLDLRAEAFNVLNHANFVGYSGTWGNGATPGPGLGAPLAGVTNQLPARQMQFSLAFHFQGR